MGRVGLRIARREGSPEHTADVAAFEQRQVERKLGNSSGEADHKVTSFPCDAAKSRLGIISADRVVDDVRPIRPHRILELLGKRLLGILVEWSAWIDDCRIGTSFPSSGRLFFGRDGGDDPGSFSLAK